MNRRQRRAMQKNKHETEINKNLTEIKATTATIKKTRKQILELAETEGAYWLHLRRLLGLKDPDSKCWGDYCLQWQLGALYLCKAATQPGFRIETVDDQLRQKLACPFTFAPATDEDLRRILSTRSMGYNPQPTNEPDPLPLLAQLAKHMRELDTKGGHITDGKFHLNP